MSSINRPAAWLVLGLALAFVLTAAPSSARQPTPPKPGQAIQAKHDTAPIMLCRRADRDRRLIGSILRINRVYLRGRYVIVELKRHTNELLTDNDYTGGRVTVSAHPSGVPYFQITLANMDRMRNLNTAIRLINWVTPLQLTERANVTAVLRFRNRRYTKTVTLTPPPSLGPTRVRQPRPTIRLPPTTR